jgi:hypothetical protein
MNAGGGTVGKGLTLDAVPWEGRVGLAKVTLLQYALTVSLARANNPKKREEYESNTRCSYGYVELWDDAMDYVTSHPLALSACAMSLEALSSFVELDYGFYDGQDMDMKESMLPKLKSILNQSNDDNDGHRGDVVAPRETIQVLLDKVKERTSEETTMAKAHRILSYAAGRPLQCVPNPYESIKRCVDTIERWYEDKDHGCCWGVERVRLSGNHSKEYLFRVGLGFPDITILDLENCSNLDETILDARQTKRAKRPGRHRE